MKQDQTENHDHRIERAANGQYFVIWRGRAVNDATAAIRLWPTETDAAAHLARYQTAGNNFN